MKRFLRLGTIAAVAVLLGSGVVPAYALMIAFKPPVQRAITADVVVVGKVTAIEKESVDAAPFPGAPNKVSYKVAVVKIETGIAGANGITHVKIGFIPPAKPDPNAPRPGPGGIRPPIRRGPQAPELKVGEEMLFFLSKHPNGEFFVMPGMSPPVAVKDENGKKELEAVKKIAAVIADPMKGLKSDKADVRTETAAVMVMKYRAYPDQGGEVDQVPINAEESKLILKALAEANWGNPVGGVRPVPGNNNMPNAIQAFYQLGLNEKDGWKPPMFQQPKPGQPPVDFNAVQKKAFAEWLAGAGKDYVIKQNVPKKPANK